MNNRQEQILKLLNRDGYVEVDALAERFEVTTQTIRRDLTELCNQGLAARVHGGARRMISTSMTAYEERRQAGIEAKTAIAQAVARQIPDNCTLALNIGTTTEQVADALRFHKDLTIVTNNINVIHIMRNARVKSMICVGGEVRLSDGAIIGSDAVDAIGKYKVDYAIIGASSVDDDGSILDFDPREVAVARAILSNARTKILVFDHSKFGISAPHRICNVGELDMIVTDRAPPAQFENLADGDNTHIIIAEKNNDTKI